MKPSAGKKIAIGYLIALPILAIVGLMQSRVFQNFTRVQEQAAHAAETIGEIEAMVASLENATPMSEGGSLGLGAGVVASPEDARAEMRSHLEHVRKLTAPNPRQSERLRVLEALIEKRIQSGEVATTPGNAGKPQAKVPKTPDAGAGSLVNDIRKIAGEIKAVEFATVKERNALARSLADKASYMTTLWEILALWLVALAALLLYRRSSQQKWEGIERRVNARVLENLPLGVCLTDDHGIILYTNPAEDALLGYKQGELMGRFLANLESQPFEDRDRLAEEIVNHLQAQGSWNGEFVAVRKDRSTFRCRTRAVAMEFPGKQYRLFLQENMSANQSATLG
ncbi:MAG TPA: PAS domain-containing protein [Terriglobia bacterium]|nr:PAS domain-containing protein [Terriglobia bacterium]